MLRQKDVKKYKKKSKYDQLLFLRKDGEYLLKNERPIKDNLIKTINPEKITKFIDDILVNKKISFRLFRSNSDFEINHYLNIKNRFFTHKSPLKRKNKDNITLKQFKKQTCTDMKKIINNYKLKRNQVLKSIDKIQKKKIKNFTKDFNEIEKLAKQEIKDIRIQGFIRSFKSIRNRIDNYKNQGLYRNNSVIYIPKWLKNNKTNKNKSFILKSISNETNESDMKSTNFQNDKTAKNNKILNKSFLPDVKLDENDVFSRLYHNVVLLSPSSNIKNKRPQSSLNKRYNSLSYDFQSSQVYNPKTIFKLKKVIKSTSGKEFTIKITKDILTKCFLNYSGGPPILKMGILKKEKEEDRKNFEVLNNLDFEDSEEDTKKPNNFVNFFKLIDKKKGNSFLHMAVLGGYDELVRYLLDKKSNINLKNYDGNTPLHLALYNKKKNKNIIDILMEYNPRLDIKNNNGEIAYNLFTDEMKTKYEVDKIII